MSRPSSQLGEMESGFQSLLSQSDRQSLLASPLFLYNLASEGSQNQLSIRPTPFGGRAPPLPTARSITVARVSSPYANNRTYQPLFLRALKDYFEMKIRMLKMGDLIAVPIRAEDARLIDGFADEDSENKAEGLRETLLDQEYVASSLLEASHPISTTCRLNCNCLKVSSCLKYWDWCRLLQNY